MSDTATDTAKAQTYTFEAEVGRLLQIVANSLYSQTDVFLRELISNASDACDRLRHEAITQPDLALGDSDYRIVLTADPEAGTLTLEDNGIGMDRDDLVSHLGTIARSGSLAFVRQLEAESEKKADAKAGDKSQPGLIGQFGVGFYSAFMVSDQVVVDSRKAGTDSVWVWESDGQGAFTIAASSATLNRGTRITLHLKDAHKDFTQRSRIEQVVRTYSDHIPIPILLIDKAEKVEKAEDTEGDADTAQEDAPKEHQLNRASALWSRPKGEITEEEYTEFYHHVGHAYDAPWLTVHTHAEGVIEYSALVFVPSMAPFDLYHPERKNHLKLYVRRVLVAEGVEGLLPSYLRFLRGVVDSQDLPLNLSREMLQHNPMVAKIKSGLTKRVLGDIAKRADADADEYAKFWDAFGPVMKEGLHEDFDNRDKLVDLLRFKTTEAANLSQLADYVARMKPGQEAIYYMTGDDAEAMSRSPHIEGFKAKGVEVVLLTDPVDEFWVSSLGTLGDKPLKSVTRAGADLSTIAAADTPDGDKDAEAETEKPSSDIDALVAAIKLTLGDAVKDVRASERLTESPVCLVADDGDMDIHLERLLKQHNQLKGPAVRIMEINPTHPLILRLQEMAIQDASDAALEDVAHLLLDQARIVEGDPLPDPAGYSRRLSSLLVKGLAA